MLYNNGYNIGLVENPLVHSIYNQGYKNSIIAPGNPKFIVTELFVKISTESGQDLTTEG